MKKITLLLVLAIFLTSCGGNGGEISKGEQEDFSSYQKYSDSFFDTFDTVVDFSCYSNDEAEFREYFSFVESEFKRLNQLYDVYKDYPGINNCKTINDRAGKEPVEVEDDLFNLIKYGKEGYEKTRGKVNIAMGSVLSIWHDYREEGIENPDQASLPKDEDLKEASKHTDIDKLILDEEKKTVYLEDPYMRLDLGAIAKGYATEIVAKELEEKGLKSAIISAGGNVRTIGRPFTDERDKWGIGIQNPDLNSQDSVSDVIYLGQDSVVTSGDYQRFYEVDGKKYSHIIDPKTLYPAQYFRSVSIVTEDSALADLMSTALFLSDKEEGEEIAKEYDLGVIWLDQDLNESFTKDLATSLKSQGAKNK